MQHGLHPNAFTLWPVIVRIWPVKQQLILTELDCTDWWASFRFLKRSSLGTLLTQQWFRSGTGAHGAHYDLFPSCFNLHYWGQHLFFLLLLRQPLWIHTGHWLQNIMISSSSSSPPGSLQVPINRMNHAHVGLGKSQAPRLQNSTWLGFWVLPSYLQPLLATHQAPKLKQLHEDQLLGVLPSAIVPSTQLQRPRLPQLQHTQCFAWD